MVSRPPRVAATVPRHVLVCPAGCGNRRGIGYPVCVECGDLVPAPLWFAVRHAWGRLQRDARPAAFLAYAAAAARAVDTVVAARELSQPWPSEQRGRVVG